ncbi:restriction endonuclease subunit S [Methylomonas sp. MED-D]|uniref:restriction endonuclease subunit S n=1 Tax=Methylomonas sp. MED-D TaxID=3418768 RepID=UPI003CFF245F
MSEWQEYLLEDVIEKFIDYRGKTPTKTDSGIPLITAKVVKSGTILPPNEFIAPEDYDSWMTRGLPEIDDVVLTTEAPLGEVALIKDKNVALAQRIITLRGNKKLLFNPFLKYYFQNQTGQHELQARASGTTVFGIKASVLKKVPISIPDLAEQKAIANLLSSLDEKIDLLHRQNKTLEAMAETLFRQWFIEEAKEDWEFVELGNYVNCFNGVSYKSDDLNASTTAMVTLKSFDRDGGFRLDGFKEFTGKYKDQHVVVQGDLVVAHTDITQNAEVIGNPVLVISNPLYETLVISMDLVKVTSKYEWLSHEFLYRMMRTREFKQHCLGFSNGSTVLHLSKEAIPTYEFLLPPQEKIKEFTRLTKHVLGKKYQNITQARKRLTKS